MLINVKHLLNVLPIDNNVRKDILAKFDSMTLDQQLDIREYCWSMYFTLLTSQIKYEFDTALSEIKEGKREFSKILFQQIEQKVTKEFNEKFLKADESIGLEQARKELQQVLVQSRTPPPPVPKSE